MTSLINIFRRLLLSPDSKFELWLRTQYHKVLATRIAFWLQDRIARYSYRRWRILQKESTLPDLTSVEQPLVSFILSMKPTEMEKIVKTIKSIQDLASDRWELLLGTDENDSLPSLPFTEVYKQINLKQASLPDVISGDYVVFCQPGDEFNTGFLHYFSQYHQAEPEAGVFYYDSEYYDINKRRWIPFFKPDVVSPALLLSTNMLTRSLIDVDDFQRIWPSLDPNQGFRALEYDLSLRLYEISVKFKHIPRLLVSQTSPVLGKSPANISGISKHLIRNGYHGVSVDKTFELPRFTWQSGDPSVSIIIPTRNNHHYLEPLLHSIENTSHNIRFSINIIDNQSTEPSVLTYYDEIKENSRINLIHYDQPFNYSEAINIGAAQSDSDLLLLMNDDMLPRNKEWLSELIQWAIQPEIGVVGAKLLRENHTIQHAGIILGLSGFVGHLYLNAPENYHGLLGPTDWYHNYLAVTGALQMIKREVFYEVGGYNTEYQLAFGDIDFCLRVHKAGYQNIYTPYAQLYHYEGQSRGHSTPANDALKGFDDFREYLIVGDPFYNPNLTYTRIPKCQSGVVSIDHRIRNLEERKGFYTKTKKL